MSKHRVYEYAGKEYDVMTVVDEGQWLITPTQSIPDALYETATIRAGNSLAGVSFFVLAESPKHSRAIGTLTATLDGALSTACILITRGRVENAKDQACAAMTNWMRFGCQSSD